MTLGAPEFLHLLWAVPLIAVGLWLASRARGRALLALFSPSALARLVPPGLERRRAWRATLICLGLALVMVAAAEPRWGFTWREYESEGVEIVVALDVSRSMDAQDVDPSRLERARREVLDLLEYTRGDRVGLVIFAGGAYPRIPMTLDHEMIREVVRDVDTEVIQAQGSSMMGALTESLDLFDEEHEADRAVVVISDGEAWDDDLDPVMAKLDEGGVRVYTLGVGTPDGAPIPEFGGGFKTDDSGQVVLTRLEESALRELASRSGGAYARSVAGASDIEGIAAEIHGALTQTASQKQREKVWDERFQWPLGAGLGLLLIAALLGDGRSARRAAAASLLALSLAGAPPASAGASDDAASTVDTLTALQLDDPDNIQVRWSLAQALYDAGRYSESRQAFEAIADRAVDPDQRLNARYNAGNAAYGEGKLEDAVEGWRRVLEQSPEHAGAQANTEAVEQEIAQRMQEQQDQDQKNQDQDQQDQDQQDQDQQDQDQQDQDQQDQDQQDQDQQDQDQQDQQGDTGQSEDQPDSEPKQDAADQSGERDEQKGDDLSEEDLSQAEAGDTGELADAPAELPQGVGEMSPQEAEKLLEGAEEGRPRVVVRGRSGGKDW